MNRIVVRYRSLFILISLLLAITIAGAGYPRATKTAVAQGAIHTPRCVNVKDNSLAIAWTTDEALDGFVDWGETQALGNSEQEIVPTDQSTHLVALTGLDPQTQIYFQVRSGALTDDNSGAYYTCTTGPTLGLTTPGNKIWGYVYESGGAVLPYALVYLRLTDANSLGSPGQSQLIVVRTDTNGVWAYDLNATRTGTTAVQRSSVADYDSYFNFTLGADEFEMWVDAGTLGAVDANGYSSGNPRVETIPSLDLQQFDTTLAAPSSTAIVSGTIILQGRDAPGTSGTITLVDISGTFPTVVTDFDATSGGFSEAALPFAAGTGTVYRIEAAHSLYLGNVITATISSTPYTLSTTQLQGGDANNDGSINILDLGCMGGAYQTAGSTCGGTGGTDINSDGITDIRDLAQAGGNYGRTSFLDW